MEIIQLFLIIFASFAYSSVLLKFKKKEIKKNEFLTWALFWISVITISIFTGPITAAANIAGVTRATDLIVYCSIVILFYLIFQTYVKVEKTNQDITKIVRNIAILKNKEK